MLLLHLISFGMLYFHFICLKAFSNFLCDFIFDPSVVLFDFYIFVNFSIFLLLLISHSIPLWLEKILVMIPVCLNLLRLVRSSVPEDGPPAPEKNVFSAGVGWGASNVSVRVLCMYPLGPLACRVILPLCFFISSVWLFYCGGSEWVTPRCASVVCIYVLS